MIIYGTKPVHLKSAQPASAVCPSCGQTGTTLLSAYSKHAHIFWIPLFPIGRLGVSQCQHCKAALDDSQMPTEIKREYNNLKAETRVPIWQFAGLGVIAVLVAFGVYANGENAKKQLEYLAAPAVGDVYEYKTDNGRYSSMKVVSVTADSVLLSANDYETDKMSGVAKIDIPENYPDETFSLAIKDIKQMHDEGDIYDINRD